MGHYPQIRKLHRKQWPRDSLLPLSMIYSILWRAHLDNTGAEVPDELSTDIHNETTLDVPEAVDCEEELKERPTISYLLRKCVTCPVRLGLIRKY